MKTTIKFILAALVAVTLFASCGGAHSCDAYSDSHSHSSFYATR